MALPPRLDDKRLHLLFIAAIAILFHLGAMVSSRPILTADSNSYIRPARFLLQTGRFVSYDYFTYVIPDETARPVRAETIRTPVYPLLLAAFLRTPLDLPGVVFLQHVLAIGISLIVYLLTSHATRSSTAALFAGVIAATHPTAVAVANQIMTETLAAALILGALIALRRSLERRSAAWAAASGLLLGVATLTRPVALYLPLLLIPLFWAQARRAVPVVIFAVSSLLLPALWAARNARETGVATISSISGDNLLFYRAGGSLVIDTLPAREALIALQLQHGFYNKLNREWPALYSRAMDLARSEGADTAALNHAQRAVYFRRVAFPILRDHPRAALAMSVSGFIELFWNSLAMTAADHGVDYRTACLIFIPAAWAASAFGAIGLVALWKRDRRLAALCGTTLFYFAVISSGPEVEPRFLVPILPLYAIVIGIGLDYPMTRARASRDGIPGPS